MPIRPMSFVDQPFVRGMHVPDVRSLADMIQQRGALMGQMALQRGQGAQATWAGLANAFNQYQQMVQQRQQQQAVLAQRQQEQQAAEALKRDEMAARAAERQEAERQRQATEARLGRAEERATLSDLRAEAADLPTGVVSSEMADRYRPTGRIQILDGAPVLMRTPTQARQAEQDAAAIAGRAEDDRRQAARDAATAQYQRESLDIQRNRSEAGPRPLTPNAESQLINRYVTQWTTQTKPYREIQRQIGMMDAGLEAARRGDMAAGNEAVLQTFLKVLDPNSVVREGEFWRLQQGQSLLKRIQAVVQRVPQGGWVTLDELEKYARLAREVGESVSSHNAGVRSRIQRNLQRYNIPEELVFDDPPADNTRTPNPSQPSRRGANPFAPQR